MSGGTTGTLSLTTSPAVAQQPGGTKVADLLEEMGHRFPEGRVQNAIPLINRAVALLSKRLYVLDSDLIKGELAIPIAASISYAASTISFISGNAGEPDTIVDTAGQFLEEGFAVGMAIYSDCPGNTSTYKIEEVTSSVITLRMTDKLVATAQGTEYTLTSRSNYGYLPDDFHGLMSLPHIAAYRRELPPVPSKQAEMTLQDVSGTPYYHKLMGDQIRIYPGTSADITIGGDYFKKVSKVSVMEDYLPFAGLFDDVIQDYLLAIMQGGPANAAGIALNLAVDLIVSKREKKPVNKVPGIDWEGMHE